MSLLSKSKSEERPMFTLLDIAEARMKKIIEKKEGENEIARKAIEQLNKEKSVLKKEHDDLQTRVQATTKDYLKILEESKAEETAIIKGQSVNEDDLAAGRVNVRDFIAVGKKRIDIEIEAESRAVEKLSKVRDIIRGLRSGLYEIIKKIRTIEENIQFQFSHLAGNFYFEIDALKKEMEIAGIGGGGTSAAHVRKQEAENDLALSKGGALYHVKGFQCASIEEVELLALDPIIQVDHLDGLRKIIGEIKKIDFAVVMINYSPCDFAGRNAGDFWYSFRPGSRKDKRTS